VFAVSFLAQLLLPIDAKNVLLPYGYVINKVHYILLYDAGQFYVKNKMEAEYKSVTFSRNSLKEDYRLIPLLTPVFYESPFKSDMDPKK